jgi:hypothetical protein
MKNDSSASETLIMALPVLLVLLALVGAVIFFPQGSLFDIRGKAAPVILAPTKVPLPTKKPESVCPDLYKPVCSTVTNITYASECEARKANALPIKSGICAATLPTTR